MLKVGIALLLVLSFDSKASNCSGGSCGTRGGGDFLEWSFYDVAKDVVALLQTSVSEDFQEKVSGLGVALKCLKVEISDNAFLDLDGRSVAAINTPSNCHVLLSRSGWDSLKSQEDRVRLVIHELLALAFIPDTQYKVSLALTQEYFHLSQGLGTRPANQFVIFSSSGVFKVPRDVSRVRVTVVGGGGGGGGGHLERGIGGGGGGAGAVRAREFVIRGTSEIVVTVGLGGAGGIRGGVNGQRGDSSSFGNFLVADGGGGGSSGYYNTSMGYGGTGAGSGGGGGGSGVEKVCSGKGGTQGSRGEDGFVSRKGGAGGAGSAWDSLTEFITLVKFTPGSGGVCLGQSTTYNGGGGGGGLVIGDAAIFAEQGQASVDRYTGTGGAGGEGFGAGGGGGTGAEGAGGAGLSGVVYVEFFSRLTY